MITYLCIHNAQHLPPEWDKLSECYFQQTPFLRHLEKYNPCRQRYYLCLENNAAIAAGIVYSLPVNVFSFARVKKTVQMHIIGVPCSVSCAGIFGATLGVEKLTDYIYGVEKGFILMLNRREKPSRKNYATGKTLPTVLFENRFADWNQYVGSLTAPYRRRLKKLFADADELQFVPMACSDFSEEMYRLYENVYERSSAKLEKLNIDFFRHLPPEFQLTTCLHDTAVIGWNIALQDGEKYYFFLGGINYRFNKQYNVYLRLLARLLKAGIESHARFIDLGQTAEIPKMRMGGNPETLFMQAKHSNLLVNKMLKWSAPLLEYAPKIENNNPFKTTIR